MCGCVLCIVYYFNVYKLRVLWSVHCAVHFMQLYTYSPSRCASNLSFCIPSCKIQYKQLYIFVVRLLFYNVAWDQVLGLHIWNKRTRKSRAFYELTVITNSGSKYNADKLIESSSFELNRPRCIIQISSLIPLRWMFVMVRLKINLGIEYNADVIQTPAITICKCVKINNKNE